MSCRFLKNKQRTSGNMLQSMLTMPTYDKVFFWKRSIHKLDSECQTNVSTRTRNERGLEHCRNVFKNY